MKATGSFLPPTMPEHVESPPLPYVNIFATTPETGTTASALLPNAGPFKSAFPQHMPAAGSETSGFLLYAGAPSSFQAAGSSQAPLVVNAGPSQASGIMPDAGSSFSAAGSSQAPINIDAGSSTMTPGARGKSLVPDPNAGFVPDTEGGDEDADGSEEESMVPEKDEKKGKKRPDPMPSGVFQVPMCLRCASTRDQICEDKWKMKCDAPPKKDGPGPASNQPPPATQATQVEAPALKAPKTIAKKLAAKAKPAVKKTAAKKPAEKVKPAEKTIKSKPAEAPAPTTSTSKLAQAPAPAPTPSTSKPAPVPAPNPSTSKKRRRGKSSKVQKRSTQNDLKMRTRWIGITGRNTGEHFLSLRHIMVRFYFLSLLQF